MEGICLSPSSFARHSGTPALEMKDICVVELPNAMPNTVLFDSLGVVVILSLLFAFP